jgi:hypothetical protein
MTPFKLESAGALGQWHFLGKKSSIIYKIGWKTGNIMASFTAGNDTTDFHDTCRIHETLWDTDEVITVIKTGKP